MNSDRLTTCPCCDGNQLDGGIDGIDWVCEECGFVVRDQTNPVPPEFERQSQDSENQREDWLSTCRVRNASEKQIALAFDELESISATLGVNKAIRQEAAEVYAEGWKYGTTDGRDTRAFIAACLRLGALRLREPIPLGRITGVDNVAPGKVRLSCSALQKEVEIHPPRPEPHDYIPFLKSTLGFSSSEHSRIKEMLTDIEDEPRLIGKNPAGTAVAVVYLADGVETQKAAGEAVGLATETVRLRLKQLRELVRNG